MGDGCMMEGISHEAAALAGTLGLGKLIAFYDDNGISIDSEKSTMEHWFTDDTPKRFEAYRWHVDPRSRRSQTSTRSSAPCAKREQVTDRPILICCKTIIGKGAPNKANTGAAHGAALGEKEVAATREQHRLEISAVRNSGRRLRGLGCASARQGARRRVAAQVRSIRAAISRAGRRVSGAAWRANCRRTGTHMHRAFLPR